MKIFVDESGTFQPSPDSDSWCCVVAYVSPEIDRAALDSLIKALRLECGRGSEVKLRDVPESRFARFLGDLSGLRGLAFAVATDTSLHTDQSVIQHRDGQADKVVEHIDKLVHESAWQGLRDLSQAIRRLPIQLYTQLICQVELFHNVLTVAVTYYALRHPPTLTRIRWRVDRKDIKRTAYENAFRTILPALIQTKSHDEPMLMIKDAGDYSFFTRYTFPPGAAPTYLKEHYGIEVAEDVGDAGKMIRDDFQFVDSSTVSGVQVADLLASGMRRVLRGHFDDPVQIAALIGANLLQAERGKIPIALIALGDGDDSAVSERTAALLKLMASRSKPYLP